VDRLLQALVGQLSLGGYALLQVPPQRLHHVVHAQAPRVPIQHREASNGVALGRFERYVKDVSVLLHVLVALPAGGSSRELQLPHLRLESQRRRGLAGLLGLAKLPAGLYDLLRHAVLPEELLQLHLQYRSLGSGRLGG